MRYYLNFNDIVHSSINAATPTALKNVMKRVSLILNNKASHMLHVTQNKIDEVLSNTIGDVRSALLNLIFLSLKGTLISSSSKICSLLLNLKN